jgi:hypothetical protein
MTETQPQTATSTSTCTRTRTTKGKIVAVRVVVRVLVLDVYDVRLSQILTSCDVDCAYGNCTNTYQECFNGYLIP